MKRVKLIVEIAETPRDMHPKDLLFLLADEARRVGAQVLFGQVYDERDGEPKA
jgi:hypothetical protein